MAVIAVALLMILAYVWPALTALAWASLGLLLMLAAIDALQLYRIRDGLFGRRETGEKFSNGDDNPVEIFLESRYPIPLFVEVIDELPFQFQRRDLIFKLQLPSGGHYKLRYHLRPLKRGEYEFGAINVFAMSSLQLLKRRYRFEAGQHVAVYPSFLQMRHYELLAATNQMRHAGLTKIRRIGHNREFEQIEEYVAGDDIRKVNWKATARRNQLMVNHYQDEQSQSVYCLLDKGRVMQMPFNGLSLLDYAINATLVISNIVWHKNDRPGLLSFQHRPSSLVPASSRSRQLHLIMEQLYRQKTHYHESDFERLYSFVMRKINHRSLLLLFTNFESVHSMRRQLPYLKLLSRQHLLVCIFFENTEIADTLKSPAGDLEEIYQKGIAEQLLYEKQLIVKELKMHGIQSVLSKPEELSVGVINKYLELKARGLA